MNRELARQMKAVGCMVGLGLIAVVLWTFFSPPKEARDAVNRLDPRRNPNPTARIDAIQLILRLALDGQRLSGWQQIQEKGCRDLDPQVRVAALQALGKFTKQKPDEVVRTFGSKFIYVDTRFLTELGRSDPSSKVRIAVAEYWAEADVLWEEGIDALEKMLRAEKDESVSVPTRKALARRIEQSVKLGNLEVAKARELQQRHNLRDFQGAGAQIGTNASMPEEKGAGSTAPASANFLHSNAWRLLTLGMAATLAYGLTFRRTKQGADAQTQERQQAGCVLIGLSLISFITLAVWVVIREGWYPAVCSLGIAVAGGFLIFIIANRKA